MCALFGWLDYKGIVSDKLLKKLTQALANAAEERGTDASGIAYVKNDKVTIFKRPKPAHKIRFNAPNGTRAIMGHTRMTTQGNEKFNFNNHPFYGRADVNFAFAHNGVLYNDKNLRMEKHLPQTQIETDSYVAVQLIEQQDKLDFDALKNMAESVQGSFCFTAIFITESTFPTIFAESSLTLLTVSLMSFVVAVSVIVLGKMLSAIMMVDAETHVPLNAESKTITAGKIAREMQSAKCTFLWATVFTYLCRAWLLCVPFPLGCGTVWLFCLCLRANKSF